jgi:hypothetical protein
MRRAAATCTPCPRWRRGRARAAGPRQPPGWHAGPSHALPEAQHAPARPARPLRPRGHRTASAQPAAPAPAAPLSRPCLFLAGNRAPAMSAPDDDALGGTMEVDASDAGPGAAENVAAGLTVEVPEPAKKKRAPPPKKARAAPSAAGGGAGADDRQAQLPQARVRRIVRADKDVGNVASDALLAITRSTVRPAASVRPASYTYTDAGGGTGVVPTGAGRADAPGGPGREAQDRAVR